MAKSSKTKKIPPQPPIEGDLSSQPIQSDANETDTNNLSTTPTKLDSSTANSTGAAPHSVSNTKPHTSTSLPKSSANKREPHRIDWRWFFLGAILVGAFAVAIFVNQSKPENSADKIASTIVPDNDDLKINWARYQTTDIDLSESFTITKSGTYHLTGVLSNGQIVVDAGVSEVRLILDNVNITNPTGPDILCYKAEDLVIESIGNSSLSDGTEYSADYNEDITGTIYSKSDLIFSGNGSLSITSHYQDAIVGKDDVKFSSGTYDITSADDAILGKDSVYITGGELNIDSAGDAIKSTNEVDHGKGFIMIEGGRVNINSNAKGLNAINTVLLYGGNLEIESFDDAIHSDNHIGIISGIVSIISGDDAIHADRELIIDDGLIDIIDSHEGLESQSITINNGNIKIKSNEDGINASGILEGDSPTSNKATEGPNAINEECNITINGGKLYINSGGDGIDSNGYIYLNDGEITVDGPTNNNNGALDASGGIEMRGGTIIALGSQGMAESLGNKSSVYNISVYFSKIQPTSARLQIKDSSDKVILEHTSAKTFSHLVAGTNKFFPGETYKIYINDKLDTAFTITDTTTTVGKPSNNFSQPPREENQTPPPSQDDQNPQLPQDYQYQIPADS